MATAAATAKKFTVQRTKKKNIKKPYENIKNIVIFASLWSKEMRNYFFTLLRGGSLTVWIAFILWEMCINIWHSVWFWVSVTFHIWAMLGIGLPVLSYITYTMNVSERNGLEYDYSQQSTQSTSTLGIYPYQLYYNFLSRFFVPLLLYSLRVFSLIPFRESRCVQMDETYEMSEQKKKKLFFLLCC